VCEYKLRLETNTDELIFLSGEFPPEDWERLKDFVGYAKDLFGTKFVQDGMNSSLKMSWTRQERLLVSVELPPWDDVMVFLHKYRPLGLVSESTHFLSVCNILTKEIENPYFRNLIGVEREKFQGKTLEKKWQFKIDDVLVNSEKTLYDWLNAYGIP